MTRKDYQLIAGVLKSRFDNAKALSPRYAATIHPAKAVNMVACELADALAGDNSAFDRARFLQACGMES